MFRRIEAYKPDLKKTVALIKKSHEIALTRSGDGMVTYRALPPSDIEYLTSFDLLKYDYEQPEERERYVKDWLALIENMTEARKNVDDIFFPNISPMLGIGDYSAFVAGDILFSRDTSWSKPVLPELNAWRDLPKLGESKWYGRFLEICERMLRETIGTGIPFMRGFFSPLDLAAALRGEAIYYDFYDEPDALHDLLDYCGQCTSRFARDIYRLTERYAGDTEYGMFYTDGINMSEDIACMISPDLYREFCAPHTQRLIDEFGKGYMHCHSRAMYLVKEICSLRNVATLWLATDPNQPRPIDNITKIVKDAQSVCVMIDAAAFEEVEVHAAELKRGNFSITLEARGMDEAIGTTQRFESLFASK